MGLGYLRPMYRLDDPVAVPGQGSSKHRQLRPPAVGPWGMQSEVREEDRYHEAAGSCVAPCRIILLAEEVIKLNGSVRAWEVCVGCARVCGYACSMFEL